jgi:peptide/nickel transport system ATP-binding protein
MCVMQAGKIVEMGPAEAIYENAAEEYTRTLIDAIPRDGLDHIRMRQKQRLDAAALRLGR